MAEKEKALLIPQYMHHFQCIGSACEDSCCVGWRVNVDEETYKKYRKVTHSDLQPILSKQVTRNRSNPSATNFAKIKMLADSRCPFLTADMLCTIHKNLGENYLSLTCATYPRTTNQVNRVMERSATMSCPEAARLALLPKEVMEFDQVLEQIDNRKVIAKVIETDSIKVSKKAERYFWELRIFTIQILQERTYPLWQRLIVLGLFMGKVQEIVESKQFEQLESVTQNYMTFLTDGSLKQLMSEIPDQTTIQMRVLKELVDERLTQGVNNQRYLQCLNQTLQGIEYKQGATYTAVMECYNDAYQKYYQPYIDENAHILENYLVNYVFRNMFPLGERGVFGEYMMLVIHFSMIKLHLIGMARYHKGLTDEQVLKLIQSFAKTVEHNSAYLRKVYSLLAQNSFDTMAHMSILIKN